MQLAFQIMQDKSIILEANYLILGKLSHKNAIKIEIKIHLLRFVKKEITDCLSNLENPKWLQKELGVKNHLEFS